MTTFISFTKRPMIIIQAQKMDRDGNIQREAIRAVFKDHTYSTDDQEIIDKIKKLPNYGVDYWEEGEKEIPKDRGPKVGVTSMPTKEEIIEGRVGSLENKMNDLIGLVTGMAKTVDMIAKNDQAAESKKEKK